MKNLPKFELPYYMALFIIEYNDDLENIEKMSESMNTLAAEQDGYLGSEQDISLKDGRDITICYWKDLESIKVWRHNLEHQVAIEKGKTQWFKSYKIQISKVEYVLGY